MLIAVSNLFVETSLDVSIKNIQEVNQITATIAAAMVARIVPWSLIVPLAVVKHHGDQHTIPMYLTKIAYCFSRGSNIRSNGKPFILGEWMVYGGDTCVGLRII